MLQLRGNDNASPSADTNADADFQKLHGHVGFMPDPPHPRKQKPDVIKANEDGHATEVQKCPTPSYWLVNSDGFCYLRSV